MLDAEERAFCQDKLIEREFINNGTEDKEQEKHSEIQMDEATLREIDSGG